MDNTDKHEDPVERRNLRYEYRHLIADTEQNRDELVQPNCSDLHGVLVKGNELFKKVRRTREAALDAKLLVLASNLCVEQAQHLQTGMVTFEHRTFAEKLITFMGGRRVDDETDDDGNTHNVRLNNLNWHNLGNVATKLFRKTAGVEFMHGPLSMDAPPKKKPKKPKENKTGEKPGAAAKITPEQLLKVENNNEEATTKEVQRVYESLLRVTDQGEEDDEYEKISFFKFVTNPHSFSQTVDNIFHLSFLINKGDAAIELDEHGLPVVYPSEPYVEKDYENEEIRRKQVVMPFTMEDWKNVIRIFDIKEPIIPTKKTINGNSISQVQNMEED